MVVWLVSFRCEMYQENGRYCTSPDRGESPYKSMGTRFCVHIVFVTSVASKNVNEKIKTQTSSPPFVGGYMVVTIYVLEGITF